MTKQPAHLKPKKKIDWDVVCEQARQRCNKLMEEERAELRQSDLLAQLLSDHKQRIAHEVAQARAKAMTHKPPVPTDWAVVLEQHRPALEEHHRQCRRREMEALSFTEPV